MYSKSQKTGLSLGSSDNSGDEGKGEKEEEDAETTTTGINSDPIVMGVRGTFD